MNAKFDYTLYVIPPGEEIFVPNGLYPTLPATTILRKTLSYTIMHLKKQTSVKQGEYCNDTKGYKYGGMYFLAAHPSNYYFLYTFPCPYYTFKMICLI